MASHWTYLSMVMTARYVYYAHSEASLLIVIRVMRIHFCS